MHVPTPQRAVAALAEFVRQRLVDVTGTLTPLWARRGELDVPAGTTGRDEARGGDRSHRTQVVVGAGAPFAATPQAQVRLLRQLHASGVLEAPHPAPRPR